jgi:anti-sigma B factor antagonist
VCASGELDMATRFALADAVRAAITLLPSRVAVDLAEVTFIDSSGIGALLEACRFEHDLNVKFSIGPHMAYRVRRIVEITRIADQFDPL